MKRFLLILFLIQSLFAFSQNVDLSSVDEFFKITNALKNGEEINQEQWQQLEQSSAYAIFSKDKKHIIDIVKKSITKVFGKEKHESDNLLENLVVENYKDIDCHYSDIKDFRSNYDFDSLISKAKIRLQTFLMIDKLDSSVKIKPVYFFFLNADGADKEEAVVIDFNLIYKMSEKDRINFIAHEFFHVYRTHFEDHNFNYANDINYMLDMIANEGIADQIDKYNMNYEQYYSTIIESEELKREFVTLYNKAEQDIEYLQEIIIQYSKSQIDKDSCIDKLLEIYKYNGHALGFYMSNQIVEAGLKDDMIKEFYNPYEFWRLYSLALNKNKGATLNQDFMTFLKEATGK